MWAALAWTGGLAIDAEGKGAHRRAVALCAAVVTLPASVCPHLCGFRLKRLVPPMSGFKGASFAAWILFVLALTYLSFH